MPKITDNKITLTCRFNPDLKDIQVDVGILHATLVNILENAIKACAADKTQPAHEIVFSAYRKTAHLVFEVADDGIGMDQMTQDKIFMPFFTSNSGHGTGLGLYFTHQILRQQGGRIEMESTLGRGSLFRVYIPKNNAPQT